MREPIFLTIIDGKGGPKGDSIPVYGTPKGPAKEQVLSDDGSGQLLLPNGTPLVSVNLAALNSDERPLFFGQYNGSWYQRVWFLDTRDWSGADYGERNQAMFVESSHLEQIFKEDFEEIPTPGPTPVPTPVPPPDLDFEDITYEDAGVALSIIIQFIDQELNRPPTP